MSLVSSFFPSSYDVLFPIPCLVEHSFPSSVTSRTYSKIAVIELQKHVTIEESNQPAYKTALRKQNIRL